jgi:hypothetical protein
MLDLIMVSLNEEETKETERVKELILKNEWDKNPEHFYKSLMQSQHSKMLTPYDVSDLAKMDLFKVPGFNVGFALKTREEGVELVAVHNTDPRVRGIGEALLTAAIANGATHLDHFDVEQLTKLYSKAGFKEYKREKYNSFYDMDGSFKAKYGPADVVYRKR